jgi:hypothetical protein
MTDDPRGDAPLSDEERARLALEQLKQVHTADLATEMMVSLVSFAYQKLGLTEHTAPVRNLGDAHLAIELLRALLAVVEREDAVPAVGDLRATLAQLQLGFAQAVQSSSGPAPAGEPAAGEPAAKKPAAKTPAAKKPAAKKPAAKKPPARGSRRSPDTAG